MTQSFGPARLGGQLESVKTSLTRDHSRFSW